MDTTKIVHIPLTKSEFKANLSAAIEQANPDSCRSYSSNCVIASLWTGVCKRPLPALLKRLEDRPRPDTAMISVYKHLDNDPLDCKEGFLLNTYPLCLLDRLQEVWDGEGHHFNKKKDRAELLIESVLAGIRIYNRVYSFEQDDAPENDAA